MVLTKGFTGSACRDASKAIEQALGLVQSDKPTAEMHLSPEVGQLLRLGND